MRVHLAGLFRSAIMVCGLFSAAYAGSWGTYASSTTVGVSAGYAWINYPAAQGAIYLQYSSNGSSWTTVAAGTGTAIGASITFPAPGTWYVRAAVNGNYPASGSPNPVAVTVSGIGTSFSPGPTNFTYNGGAQGPSANPSPGGASYDTSGTSSAVDAGSYTVQYDANGSYSGSSGPVGWTISPQSVGFSLSSTSFTYNGGWQGPSVNASVGGATFSTGGTLSAISPGTYTASASAYGNYSGSDGGLTWTINKADQWISFGNPGTQTYGGNCGLSASSSSGLPVSFSVASGPATLSGSTLIFTGAGTVTVIASQSGDGNYNAAASVGQTFTVNKANQSVTFANPGAQTYGTSTTLSPSASSGLNVTLSVVSGSNIASVSFKTVTFSGTGTVTLRASQGGDVNYNAAAPVDQSFTVNPASQTITFDQPPAQTYLGNYALDARATSTLPVSYSITSGTAHLAGNVVTFDAAGSVTVQAAQGGNVNFYAAPSVSRTITVNKANQTITFNSPGSQTYGTPVALTASVNSPLAVVFSVLSGPATLAGNTLTFTGVGAVTVRASQAGSVNYNAASNVDQTFTVNKATPAASFSNRSLGTQDPTTYITQAADFNAAFTGPANAAAPSGTIAYTRIDPATGNSLGSIVAGTALAIGQYTIRASYPGDANYNATTKDAIWTVTTDVDGDGIPGYIETQIGTDPNVANPVTTDSAHASNLNVDRPKK